MSLPSRERGLKLQKWRWILRTQWVAPLAGAWIEISMGKRRQKTQNVAPLAGAWIEMSVPSCIVLGLLSLPSRERGLKFACHAVNFCAWLVAPLAGAWIEIYTIWTTFLSGNRSLPSRERGLKFAYDCAVEPSYPSLPSRERGLKFSYSTIFYPCL